MIRKLKTNKGLTMSLSIIIAVVLTAVSLAISALVATVATNQVNASKRNFSRLAMESQLYDFIEYYYSDTENNIQKKIQYNGTEDFSTVKAPSGVTSESNITIYENDEAKTIHMYYERISSSSSNCRYMYDSTNKIGYYNYHDSISDKNYAIAIEFVSYDSVKGIYKVDLTITEADDFTYGFDHILKSSAVKYRINFGFYTGTVKSMETVEWAYQFYYQK